MATVLAICGIVCPMAQVLCIVVLFMLRPRDIKCYAREPQMGDVQIRWRFIWWPINHKSSGTDHRSGTCWRPYVYRYEKVLNLWECEGIFHSDIGTGAEERERWKIEEDGLPVAIYPSSTTPEHIQQAIEAEETASHVYFRMISRITRSNSTKGWEIAVDHFDFKCFADHRLRKLKAMKLELERELSNQVPPPPPLAPDNPNHMVEVEAALTEVL